MAISLYRRRSPRGRVRLLLAVLGVALLAASCTHTVMPRAARTSAPGVVQVQRVWPSGQPISYGVIECGGDSSCSSGFTGAVPAALRRPLHLPGLAHGHCPILRAGVVESGVGAAEGPGPVYPVIGGPGGRFGVLTFAYPPLPGSLLAGSGFGGQKVLWIGAPRYRGPVLIRGGQLGGNKPVMFNVGTGTLFDELQFAPQSQYSHAGLPSRGWRGWPSSTDLRAPGCYAWQIDGATFSYTVVFKAVQTR